MVDTPSNLAKNIDADQSDRYFSPTVCAVDVSVPS